jgi:AraC-like DNA-binding protein
VAHGVDRAILLAQAALGLRFGETVDCADDSVVAMMSRACATVGDAIVQRNRYGRLLGEFGNEPADAWVVQPCGRNIWLMGAILLLPAAHFTHPEPPYRAEYERVFQAPLVFGCDRNALLLDAAWLQLKIAQVPSCVFGILSAQVERLLMSVLHTGEVGVSDIARRLGTSRQTLYRRRKAEGTNYEQLLDELGHRMSLLYLDGRKVSVNETACLVGFSDPAAFSRAFKRWTGKSPARRPVRSDSLQT